MENMKAYNMKLLANILPMHVAQHFLRAQNSNDEVRVMQSLSATTRSASSVNKN